MGEKKFSLLIITGEKQPDIEISSAKRAILQGVVKPKVWRQCWGCKKYMEEGKMYCEKYIYGNSIRKKMVEC